ncbi:MAG: hypothetical protein WB817_13420 [Terriglobales bacterium]
MARQRTCGLEVRIGARAKAPADLTGRMKRCRVISHYMEKSEATVGDPDKECS